MKKEFVLILSFIFLVLPLASATTTLEIQTVPYMDVWVTAQDAGDSAIKVPELYSVDMCGRVEIDYDISESSFYLLLRVKDGDSLLVQESFEEKFYKDTEINLTVLPEDYVLDLPEVCHEVNPAESSGNDSSVESVSLNEASKENESINGTYGEGIEGEENSSEVSNNSGFFVTGYSFVEDNILSKNLILYSILFVLIVLIIYLAAKNKSKDHLLHEYEVHNKFPVHKNQRKIDKLKKKIEKYEKEIIKLRQEDFNPSSKEKFKSKKLKRKDVLGSEKNDTVHVSDLDD